MHACERGRRATVRYITLETNGNITVIPHSGGGVAPREMEEENA